MLKKDTAISLLLIFLITLISFFTYFKDRASFDKLIWDEHYHIANAQKYINHVFFMEPHPPFGKMLIAWGEMLIQANEKNDQALKKMKADAGDFPVGFSLKGYRFFPVLLAWLTAPLLFLILKQITKNNIIAFIFSLFYSFDTALITHFRTAMLDSTLLFFMMLNLFLYLLLRTRILNKDKITTLSILFGISFALTMTTKITGLINIIFPIHLLYLSIKNKMNLNKNFIPMILSFTLIYVAVWEYHFNSGKNVINTLDANGYFIKDDKIFKKIVDEKGERNIFYFFTLLKKNAYTFVKQYEKGVAPLNLCNEDENGSPVFFWPIGARSIQYNQITKDNITRYIYLQVNPVIWFIGLIGAILGISIFVSSCFGKINIIENDKKDIFYILTLSYVGYMGAMLLINRVMYLYHYFPALIFSLLILASLLSHVDKIFTFKLNKKFNISVGVFISLLVVVAFYFYSPLSYFKPMSPEMMKKLSLLSAWDLKCANCERTNHFATPTKKKNEDRVFETNLQIGDVDSFFVQQDWGDPKIGKSVEGKDVLVDGKKYSNIFGLHANSKIKYRLKGKYNNFSVSVGLPDYLHKEGNGVGSIIFKIIGDGKILWQSSLMSSGKKAELANINISKINILELVMDSANDGINYDHGVWLDPLLSF